MERPKMDLNGKKDGVNMEPITPKDAKALGFVVLTVGYQLPNERKMMENVCRDLQRRNTEFALVRPEPDCQNLVEVWRKREGMVGRWDFDTGD